MPGPKVCGGRPMIVMKFGGTSVESATAIERLASIVRARAQRKPVVVVSAMGKTTNKLLAIANAAIGGNRADYIAQIHDLRDFHSREARLVVPLSQRPDLDRTLDEHFQELTARPFASSVSSWKCSSSVRSRSAQPKK